MFPTNKGKITSIVMIASSIANYVILNIAGIITKSGELMDQNMLYCLMWQ